VRDQAAVDEAALRALGARGIVRPSPTALQVVLGPVADAVAVDIRDALAADPKPIVAEPAPAPTVALAPALLAALGGHVGAASVHAGRLRVEVADDTVDEAALRDLGIRAIARPAPGVLHLLAENAAALTV
jgi:phosphotransferase system IIB component